MYVGESFSDNDMQFVSEIQLSSTAMPVSCTAKTQGMVLKDSYDVVKFCYIRQVNEGCAPFHLAVGGAGPSSMTCQEVRKMKYILDGLV